LDLRRAVPILRIHGSKQPKARLEGRGKGCGEADGQGNRESDGEITGESNGQLNGQVGYRGRWPVRARQSTGHAVPRARHETRDGLVVAQ
jgi:hypothetical protein